MQMHPPVRYRPQLHGQAEERHQALAGNVSENTVVALDGHRRQHAVRAMQRRQLAEGQIHLARRHQLAHRVDRMRRGAEFVAPVHKGDACRDGLQIQRPVQRRVAAADDQHALATETLHLAHRIEDRFAFVVFYARNRGPLGLERAAARRDHHRLAFKHLARVAGNAKTRRFRRAQNLKALDHLAIMKHRAERLDLLQQIVGQALAGDDGEAGNVIDRLFRIQLGALAAGLGQYVDEMRLDVEQAQLKHRKQADWPRADNDNIRLDNFRHVSTQKSAGLRQLPQRSEVCGWLSPKRACPASAPDAGQQCPQWYVSPALPAW